MHHELDYANHPKNLPPRPRQLALPIFIVALFAIGSLVASPAKADFNVLFNCKINKVSDPSLPRQLALLVQMPPLRGRVTYYDEQANILSESPLEGVHAGFDSLVLAQPMPENSYFSIARSFAINIFEGTLIGKDMIVPKIGPNKGKLGEISTFTGNCKAQK